MSTAITDRYETLKHTVKIDRVGDSSLRWEGDTAHVSVKALGQRATATIDVAEENLTITIILPMILSPFKGAIVAFLESQEDAVKGAPRQVLKRTVSPTCCIQQMTNA